MSDRCVVCRARLGLIIFNCAFCKCKFCAHHRLPEDHECTHISVVRSKYKEMNKQKLEANSCKEIKIVEL